MIYLDGPPQRWVVRHGKPADCTVDGMPSFVSSRDERLVVLDALMVWMTNDGQVRLLSTWYGVCSIVAQDDALVPLHHNPEALWEYRPQVYRLNAFTGWEIQGSQEEMQFRRQLADTMHARFAGRPFTMGEAIDKARALLLERLTSQERIEYLATGAFRVRGASGSLYRVTPGNGFELVSPYTDKAWISFCLHPEEWIPHEDVALATKLALQDEEMEQQVIGRAGSVQLRIGRGATGDDLAAMRLERKLL